MHCAYSGTRDGAWDVLFPCSPRRWLVFVFFVSGWTVAFCIILVNAPLGSSQNLNITYFFRLQNWFYPSIGEVHNLGCLLVAWPTNPNLFMVTCGEASMHGGRDRIPAESRSLVHFMVWGNAGSFPPLAGLWRSYRFQWHFTATIWGFLGFQKFQSSKSTKWKVLFCWGSIHRHPPCGWIKPLRPVKAS